MSLNKLQIEQIRKTAKDDESKIPEYELKIRGSGFMYANIGWSSSKNREKKVVFAEEFINLSNFKKFYYVQLWSKIAGWKQKTFENREKALKLYHRILKKPSFI